MVSLGGCICLKIDVIAANEKYLKTIGHFLFHSVVVY